MSFLPLLLFCPSTSSAILHRQCPYEQHPTHTWAFPEDIFATFLNELPSSPLTSLVVPTSVNDTIIRDKKWRLCLVLCSPFPHLQTLEKLHTSVVMSIHFSKCPPPLNLPKSVSSVLITAVSPNLSSFFLCTLQSTLYMICRIALTRKVPITPLKNFWWLTSVCWRKLKLS